MIEAEHVEVFALFDDCDATATRCSSRLYTAFVFERVCAEISQLDAVCEIMAEDTRRGLHAVVLADYEFGRNLLKGPHFKVLKKTYCESATLRFLLFERCERLSRDDVDEWLRAHDGGTAEASVAGTANVHASVDQKEFNEAIYAIHAALQAGESYQVNYTYRLNFDVFGSPFALYRRLRSRQPVPYGALIALPGAQWVLSCSPELFIRNETTLLSARPMKGTAPRSVDPVIDRQIAEFLEKDPKNRAENVMIVDLLRNDISRVAQTGSVNVPRLFSVEPYASVWQMTSTVHAMLRAGTSFAEILRALFPCGSITGAPKYRSMQLIEEIESTPRGLYTGLIGWLDSPSMKISDDACGDFCLSVVIRTLILSPSEHSGGLQGKMGVGAGIVLDSVAALEYAECQLKARFLTDADPGFELFETMYATRETGVRNLSRHFARLSASASTFGFKLNDHTQINIKIAEKCAVLPPRTPHKMRLVLSKYGIVNITTEALAPLAEQTVGLLLGPDYGFPAVDSNDLLLRHKITRRAEYDSGWREAETRGAFDTLFFNERGELTEGGRSNVFVKLNGRWWTPPLESGVLPGIMRSELLKGNERCHAAERVLTKFDLQNAEALIVCNALRGVIPAYVVTADCVHQRTDPSGSKDYGRPRCENFWELT